MQIEDELAGFIPPQNTILTIGVFDGVHIGHQHLFAYSLRQALVRDCLAGVVTFSTHPREILSPQTRLPYLTGLAERIRLIKDHSMELVTVLSFTPELSQIPARQFTTLLQKHPKMQGLVIGPDFTLGRDKEGDAFLLHTLGREMGFTVEVVPPALIKGEVVSSTAIRRDLAEGNMSKVMKFLGRPFSLTGLVVHGAGRGRPLGFPTANLLPPLSQALPPDGVYVSRAYLNYHSHPAVTNIGRCPTFGEGERTVEVHLLDFSGEVYGQEIKIELIERLREERRFSSVEELIEQIKKDVEQARKMLE